MNQGNMYVNFEFFLFGLLTNASLTTLAKILIGRLRPNFLSMCGPKLDPYAVLCDRLGKKYLIPGVDFECASNFRELDESRRSFPSGHSSSTFYTMIFLILYANKFWTKRELGLLVQLFQVVCFGLAVFVALSRILDNMHHVTDVLAGSVLGILVAIFTFYYLRLFYARHNYTTKFDELAPPTNTPKDVAEVETFVDEPQQQPNKATINLPSMEIRYDL